MMKLFTLILVCLFCNSFLQAQNSIKGVVSDTMNKQNLFNSSVSLLRAKDSVLVSYTRSSKEGNFEFRKVDTGRFILMVTYPRYADYFDPFDFTESLEKDLLVICKV